MLTLLLSSSHQKRVKLWQRTHNYKHCFRVLSKHTLKSGFKCVSQRIYSGVDVSEGKLRGAKAQITISSACVFLFKQFKADVKCTLCRI